MAVDVEFDVATEDVADGMTTGECSDALRAGEVGSGVVDDEAAGHQEIAGEQQRGLAVVVTHVRITVAGRGNHVDDAVAQVDLRVPLGQSGKPKNLRTPSRSAAATVTPGRCWNCTSPVR